ncbi:glycosyltransferase family 4 protein [Novosphingobium resinovorum]|uniref:glycosyltransferase family 4 protein n=1 Tax=Novosphingobium resinovorum TaxID=158500 RepID=UPI002ED46890|nr:glycosyltransferase family 4 protein [Novosphingobium resinovorum]
MSSSSPADPASPPPAAVILTCEYPPFPGGIGTYSGELVAALAGAGIAVEVIAPSYPDLPDEVRDKAGHHLLLGHHHISPMAALRVLAVLRRAPRSALILAADIRTVLLLWLLRPFHRRAYRVMVHGSEASKFDRGGVLFAIARRAYHRAQLVAYNSVATRDIFRARLGIPCLEAVTYLGVDRQWFEAAPTASFEHPELAALPPDAAVFCTVGRIEARKGQVQAIRALAQARTTMPRLGEAVYVIAGRTEDEDYAKQIVEEARRLSVRVIVTGRLSTDDIKRLFRRSLAHLLFAVALPGKIEGFGLVLLEAAAQECPSIVTGVGGIPEVLGSTGALVEEGDLEGFARHIVACAEAVDRRGAAGRAARLCARRFTWTACAKATFPEFAGLLHEEDGKDRETAPLVHHATHADEMAADA